MENKGLFITFEGGDGTGKSTQIKMLNEYIKSKNISTHLTREPGGCPIAERIREIILTGKVDNLDELSEFLLFTAARHEHVRQVIAPKLELGICVLSDRFYQSSYVYQSFAGGLDFNFVEDLTNKAVGKTQPNLTVILDIDPVIGLERAKDRELFQEELRMESKAFKFHKKVREGFLKSAETSKNSIVINANQTIEKVHQDIIKAIEEKGLI